MCSMPGMNTRNLPGKLRCLESLGPLERWVLHHLDQDSRLPSKGRQRGGGAEDPRWPPLALFLGGQSDPRRGAADHPGREPILDAADVDERRSACPAAAWPPGPCRHPPLGSVHRPLKEQLTKLTVLKQGDCASPGGRIDHQGLADFHGTNLQNVAGKRLGHHASPGPYQTEGTFSTMTLDAASSGLRFHD